MVYIFFCVPAVPFVRVKLKGLWGVGVEYPVGLGLFKLSDVKTCPWSMKHRRNVYNDSDYWVSMWETLLVFYSELHLFIIKTKRRALTQGGYEIVHLLYLMFKEVEGVLVLKMCGVCFVTVRYMYII